MEGLEISEIRRSRLNDDLRYEAEYFRKRYLTEDAAIRRWPTITLSEVAAITDGPHGYHVVDPDSDVVMLTAKNAKNWFTDRDGADPLALYVHEENLRSSLEEDDIVLSTRGTVGCCALVTSEVLPANLDQDVARISGIDAAKLLPTFVAAYLNCSFGQDHIHREASGMVQQGLSLNKVRAIPIPRLPMSVQEAVDQTVREALRLRRSATAQLAAAEQTLLHALGLDAWQPPEPLTYLRRASEALKAVRLDAEHFKPKFDDLIAHLKAGGDAIRLDQVLSFCERGRQPAYADEGVIVVNSRHVRTDAVILDGENRFATVEDETLLIRHGDILLNGTGVGTIGRVSTYLHDTQALPDNHVTILRLHPESGFDPVFLAVQLAGVVGQTQVEQHTRGSSGQLELYPQDIRRILVWRAPKEMQLAVRKNIEAAHAARREAQALLARAQRAVEVAIEQGEPAALKLLAP